MRYITIKTRNTDYPNPLNLKRGMNVKLREYYTGNKEWNNWIRCIIDNNEGWIPAQIVKRSSKEEGIILEDYTANELNIKAGDILEIEKELNGWCFGFKIDEPSLKGWVPRENLKEA